MDALADYSSDDNSDTREVSKRKKSAVQQGDNYDNVTMDLSEGSDDNGRESSRSSKNKERGAKSKSRRHDGDRKDKKSEGRHHKSKHSKNRDERREEKRDRREDRSKSDREKKYTKRSRSRSSSPRRRSKSRERTRDRNRDFKSKRIPLSVEAVPGSSTGGDKEGSMSPQPAMRNIESVPRNVGNVPGFTNNPTLARIQEQLQKRRALWSNKSAVAKETCAKSGNNWESTLLPKDDDGKMTAKFKRLMGMKGAAEEAPVEPEGPKKPPTAVEQQKKQDAMFNSMERQYEVARLATHTHRGIGLGFGTFQCNPRS